MSVLGQGLWTQWCFKPTANNSCFYILHVTQMLESSFWFLYVIYVQKGYADLIGSGTKGKLMLPFLAIIEPYHRH